MDQSGTLLALIGSAEALVLMFLALWMVKLGTAQYALVAPHDAEAVPLLHVLALIAGVVSGIALVLCVPHGEAFRPSRIFSQNSPWEISLLGFLFFYALPRWDTLVTYGSALLGDAWAAQVVMVRASAVASLLGPLFAIRMWSRSAARRRAISAFLLLAFYITLITHYAVHLAIWTAAQLNFWLFAVLLVLFQRWRYAEPAHH